MTSSSEYQRLGDFPVEPEDFGQSHDGHHSRGDRIGQDRARANRGKLVHVTHQDHAGVGRNGPQNLMAQNDIDHRNLVEHE